MNTERTCQTCINLANWKQWNQCPLCKDHSSWYPIHDHIPDAGKMITAENILLTKMEYSEPDTIEISDLRVSTDTAIEAMESFAKQQAIEFHKMLAKKGITCTTATLSEQYNQWKEEGK